MKKYLFYIGLIYFFSCKKDVDLNIDDTKKPVEIAKTAQVSFNITNVVGSKLLALGTQTYVNENSDTFKVNTYKYYISNIKLIRNDGYIFSEPESYRLIDQSDTTTTCKFTITNVPLGVYTSVKFIIGVDSLRNVSGAQTGVLDPLHDMFWSWSQGYIFAKLEGTSPQANGGQISYHIGGFFGQYNCIKTVSPSFDSKVLQVEQGKNPVVFLKSNVLEWFTNPNHIDLQTFFAASGGPQALQIAENYERMFSVPEIKN